MSELVNLTLLSLGFRVVVSYPSEPDPFFERILGLPVGDGTCWVSIGGDSTFIFEDLGNVAVFFNVRDSLTIRERPLIWNRSCMLREMKLSDHWSNLLARRL